MPKLGFERNVYSILGLPFDAVTMAEAVNYVHSAVDDKQPCFISTPNLNFLIASQSDEAFRQSVINSDLSLADGMPVIWVAKLLGIPITERVAGSGLVEALMNCKKRVKNPVKVFFFGGMHNVAAEACQKLQEMPSGLTGVGSLNPGMGSIENMSQPHIIDAINNSGAEFVIVALGAKKGQAWIEHNRGKLKAPVISHLGAVVNFIAGTVSRAPVVFQRLGLEWLWRIKEEPALWKRYFFDGLTFLKLLITKVVPCAALVHRNKEGKPSALEQVAITEKNKQLFITMKGTLVTGNVSAIKLVFSELPTENKNIYVNLANVEYIDSSFIALLLLLYKRIGVRLEIKNVPARIKKIFHYNGAGFLLK